MKTQTLSTFGILLILGSILASCGGMRQMQRQAENIRMEAIPNKLEVHSDSIEVEIRGEIPQRYLHRRAHLVFEPTLYYGDQTYPLKEYVIAGENVEGIEYDQVMARREGGRFTIRDKFPYEPAMRNSTLCMVLNIRMDDRAATIHRCQEDPRDTLAHGAKDLASTVRATDDILFSGEREPQRMGQQAVIRFEINKADIRRSERQGESIKNLWEFAKTPNLVLRRINIDSYASPDGPQTLNERLSNQRDRNSFNFIKKELLDMGHKEAHDTNFYRETTDEDWEGFTAAVRGDRDIPEREWVMEVMNSDKSLSAKENELRTNEEVWDYLADNIFPPLRRSDIELRAVLQMRTPEEVAEIGAKSLDSLNNRELLVYAYNLHDLETEMEVHQHFNERFPDDWVGYGNMARMHLKKGNYDQAEEYLNQALELNAGEGSLLNNKAVLQRRQGKYYEAAETLNRARAAGVNVNNNMGIVLINQANYEEAVNAFPADQCDYNAALAHLLNGDEAGALERIECIADKSAHDFYLRAVVAARQGDMELLTTSLTRAVQADGQIRDLAKDDLEFAGYRDREAFRNAIR
jgi:tetratricopeptide (TPR) repeat protein